MAYDKEYGDATVDFGSVFDSYDGEVTNDSFNATALTLTLTLETAGITPQSTYVSSVEAITLTLYGPTLRIDSSVTDTAQTLALTLKDPAIDSSCSFQADLFKLRLDLGTASIQRYIYNPIDKSGCPMCGTYLYRRGANQFSRRRIPSETVRSGRNFDKGDYDDNAYIKCSKCGFICNTQRDQYSHEGSRIGWGVKYEEVEAG